jgi:hypothetical protein
VPDSTRGKRAWRQAAALVSEYRAAYRVTDPEHALGPATHDPAQRADRQRATAAIERVHHKQRLAEGTRHHAPIRTAGGREVLLQQHRRGRGAA